MPVTLNELDIAAPPADVFRAICDPRTYPRWLVGAQDVLHTDSAWPTEGSTFHHRIGFGPFRAPGSTSVRRIDAPHELVLGAGMGPFGEAEVCFRVVPSSVGTRVFVEERPRRGLARLAGIIAGPVVKVAFWGRSAVSLASLRDLLEEPEEPEELEGRDGSAVTGSPGETRPSPNGR